ncbi:MAG: helix-hairpin-helix domain-containing protein [Anaerolineae bacterium]
MAREKLVRVEIEPGRFVKMYPKDVAKMRQAPEDKMRVPSENKAADDFTEINRIGPATAEELREQGYRTFDDLREADLDDLPSRAQGPVEEWRE